MTTNTKIFWIFIATIVVIVLSVAVLMLIAYIGAKHLEQEDRLALESYKQIQQKYTRLERSKDEAMTYSNIKSDLLKGSIKELPFVCFTFKTGIGKGTVYWTQFEFQHGLDLEENTLLLYAEDFFAKLEKPMGLINEMEIGVADFDKHFLVYSSNETLAKQILTIPIREKLLNIPTSSFGELILSDQSLIYKVPYKLSDKKNCDYFIEMIAISQNLLLELK